MSALGVAHRARVQHLYRNALRVSLNWAVSRPVWITEVSRIRGEFEKHRHEADPSAAERLVAKGEEQVTKFRHPDPYTLPTSYGGTKYARSPPVPPEVHVVMDFSREEGTAPAH